MPQSDQFPAIFSALKEILEPLGDQIMVKLDTEDNYTLETPTNPRDGKPFFFGSTVIKKNYVSFHLMPIYTHPELLEEISPELDKRRQGKSCFNFKKTDEALIGELKELVNKGFGVYAKGGYL